MDIIFISGVSMIVISSLAVIACIAVTAVYMIKKINRRREIVHPIFIDQTLHGNIEFIESISSTGTSVLE